MTARSSDLSHLSHPLTFPAGRNVYQHGQGTKYSGTNRRLFHSQHCNIPEESFILINFCCSVLYSLPLSVKVLRDRQHFLKLLPSLLFWRRRLHYKGFFLSFFCWEGGGYGIQTEIYILNFSEYKICSTSTVYNPFDSYFCIFPGFFPSSRA